MKKFRYIVPIAAIFILLRVINLGSAYLWYDEIDIIWKTFGDQAAYSSVLATSFYNVTRISTSPWLPIFILHGLVRLFGHHILVLRLPPLLFSLISLLLLNAVLNKIFSDLLSRMVPLFLFAFSVPAIIFSQSPQPSICYFLAPLIQIFFFIEMVNSSSANPSRGRIAGNILIFSAVSIIAFLLSWMSIITHVLLLLYYALFLAHKARGAFVKRLAGLLGLIALSSIPLGVMACLRYRMGMHRVIHEVGGVVDLVRLTYEFLTYHFNYAYSLALYRPLGFNPTSLPFVVLFLVGFAYFFLSRRPQRIPAAVVTVAFLSAVYFNIMPLGGIRHSLAVSPFLFIFAGYGVEAVEKLTDRLGLSRAFFKGAMAVLLALMLLIFFFSGVDLYDKRRSTLNLSRIIEAAEKNRVRDVAGFMDTYRILAVWDRTAGNKLAKAGLRLRDYRPAFNENLKEKYLLVSYRSAFDADFAGGAKWPANIPSRQFEKVRITPIEEVLGPLKPDVASWAYHQSIYYPINGSFIYLIEPKQQHGI